MRDCWRIWPSNFEVDELLAEVDASKVETATTFMDDSTQHRRSKVSWLTGNDKVHGMLNSYIAEARNFIDVEVGFDAEIQYTEYHASEGGKYDWHHDVHWEGDGPTDRKLSLTVQLSDPADYEGGNFEFAACEQLPPHYAKQRGTVVVFPSYLSHRVSPVTSGVRKSLVAWFHGPRWR